jgi:hypothetical protein
MAAKSFVEKLQLAEFSKIMAEMIKSAEMIKISGLFPKAY